MLKSSNNFQFVLLALAVLACLCLPGCKPATEVPLPATNVPLQGNILRAGLRSSSYGPQQPFPDPVYWVNTSKAMAHLFPSSVPAVVWIVGEIQFVGTSGVARLNFPSPNGQVDAYPDIFFSGVDMNEVHLTQFDQNGVKVWLQVEPGDTDVLTLIDLILSRYRSHPCVIGFGVDVEWYKWDENSSNEGSAVTDAEAQAWSERVRSYNPDYQLFMKHWLVEKMPPTYRTGMMFLDDSQKFSDLPNMVDDFKIWGEAFAPSPVGFQFGYEADQPWWSALSNPPLEIGREILNNVTNTTDLYWVDFTMERIWPRTP